MTRTLKSFAPNHKQAIVLGILVSLLFGPVTQAQSSKGTPVFKITPAESKITFSVQASVSIAGTSDKWDASMKFTSTDVSTGVLDVKTDASSVNTESGFKDGKLRSEDFFDVEKDPYITFHPTKVVQTGPLTFDAPGTFTIRGVSKPERLIFTVDREGQGTGEIKGTMSFDRKEFGMNSGIPFIRIADRVKVTVDLKVARVGETPLVFKQ